MGPIIHLLNQATLCYISCMEGDDKTFCMGPTVKQMLSCYLNGQQYDYVMGHMSKWGIYH